MFTSAFSQAVVAVMAMAVPVVLYNTRKYTRRVYYTIKSIKDRHKPLDENVWDEKDIDILLMKIVCSTSRSMGVTFMMWPERQFRGTFFAYIYFRVIDTLADEVIGKESKIEGLRRILKRLDILLKGEDPGPFDVSDLTILDHTPKLKSYKYIVQNAHRFDVIFHGLENEDKQIIYGYSKQLAEGNIRLCQLEKEQTTERLEEECHTAIEISLTEGFLPIFGYADVAAHIRDGITVEGKAWKSWAFAMCLSQLISTIESDMASEIFIDDELLTMKEIDPYVISKIRTKYLKIGLENYCQTKPFFLYEPLMKSVGLRLMFLQFTFVAINCYERELAKIGLMPQRKFNVWWVMFRSTVESALSTNSYVKGIERELERAKDMLLLFPKETL